MSEKKSKKFPYDLERVAMNFNTDLLDNIDTYQVNHYITFRSGAILELIRLGLANFDKPSNVIVSRPHGDRGAFLHLSLSYPVPLLKNIDKYKTIKKLSTRTMAIDELIQIGLQNPLENKL